MAEKTQNIHLSDINRDNTSGHQTNESQKPPLPLPNYTLSTVCPACDAEMFRLACKVRCTRCGFMWDCSEVRGRYSMTVITASLWSAAD